MIHAVRVGEEAGVRARKRVTSNDRNKDGMRGINETFCQEYMASRSSATASLSSRRLREFKS